MKFSYNRPSSFREEVDGGRTDDGACLYYKLPRSLRLRWAKIFQKPARFSNFGVNSPECFVGLLFRRISVLYQAVTQKKVKKENEKKRKGVCILQIEEIKTTQKTDTSSSTHAASKAGLYPLFIPPVTPVLQYNNAYANAQMELLQSCRPSPDRMATV